jgi:hypothetical protein
MPRNTRIPEMRRANSSSVLRAAVISAAVAAFSVLAGCGGGGSDSTTAAAGTGSGNAASGSANFRSFGEEASASEQAAAAGTVEEFLRARADGDAARECSLMSASAKSTLAQFGGGLEERSQPCPKSVKAITSQIRPNAVEQPGPIQVIGMRVDGERGFVLYRDRSGDEFAFSVIREGAVWKAGGIAGYRLQ